MYHFVFHDNEVIALSTYAGHPVRGIVKCSPEDTFNSEFGKRLATARCEEKIARKRKKKTLVRLREAIFEYNTAKRKLEKMDDYARKAISNEQASHQAVEELLKEVNK